MATSSDTLRNVLDEVASRLSDLAGARVEPHRLVVALDDSNVTQAWITTISERQLLSVQVRSLKRVARDAWPAVLRDLNTWNRDHRLTSAWLLVDDWELSSEGAVVVEAALPVTAGHTADQLVDYVEVVLADGARFWSLEPA